MNVSSVPAKLLANGHPPFRRTDRIRGALWAGDQSGMSASQRDREVLHWLVAAAGRGWAPARRKIRLLRRQDPVVMADEPPKHRVRFVKLLRP